MSTILMGAKWRTQQLRFGVLLILCAALLASFAGSTEASAAGRRPGHVYLMRGVLNVFSWEWMNSPPSCKPQALQLRCRIMRLAGPGGRHRRELSRRQPRAHHPDGPFARRRCDHLRGAQAAGSGVPVALIVNFDPVSPDPVPPNVRQIVNYYVPAGWGQAVAADKRFKGNLANVNENATDNHFSIDKSDNLHRKTIAKVLQVTGGARRVPRKPANARVSARRRHSKQQPRCSRAAAREQPQTISRRAMSAA